MTVKPRGESFQATVHHKGERYRQDFETERDALIWEAETKAALLKGQTVTRARSGIELTPTGTMQGVLDKATRQRWSRSRGTVNQVRNATIFVKWVGGALAPSKALTQNNVDKFVEHLMRDRRVANATINKYMSAISILCEHAKLEQSPDMPFFKLGQGRVRFFSPEEELSILRLWTQWGKTQAHDLMVCLLDLGARPWAELCKAEWRDIDCNQRRITFWDTKNGMNRTLPMTTRVVQAIQRQLRDAKGPFVSVQTGAMQELWDKTQAMLPVLNDAVLYSARHTCASRLVQRGVDLRRVKEWMGHKSITTTLIYAHLAPASLEEIVGVLEPEGANVTPLRARKEA